MTHYISLTNEAGHVVMTPLWKLPALVAAEVEAKKGDIEAIKAQKAAKEAAEKAAEEAARQAAIQATADLDRPFDLTVNPGIG